jgi:2-methylisocitrate lyase-like PEP mutase family enzyme
MDHAAKVAAFQKLHADPGCFIIPNPWDRGSARMLEAMGFKALATTSAGYNFSRGQVDGEASVEDHFAHFRDLSASVDVPVNADFENAYAETAEGVAENIRLAAGTGLAGGSLEDYDGKRIYDMAEAVDRLTAAVEAARAVNPPFVLTARAENLIRGNPDLDDTIKRLQAYQEAGADVLYAPGLKTADEVRAVVTSVDRPVNVLGGIAGMTLNHQEMADLGVKRVSVGGSLFRSAFGKAMADAREMLDAGTFSFATSAPPGSAFVTFFRRG